MRLRKIKLAGFKSFVDPTTLKLPGNLTGIVGPNGCGKSNVIDAVRWVMGETSAKHLRGDTMDDVIFNGSSSRKPVGMASVELMFDNSDGKAPGPYAKYNEISVKRVVTRDGQSKYFLNSTRCRRRDIADLFLGTGLGPRSYAIIEQGMISRLIEAKPEEMRVYLEEAAGISKYKERRRETENRIRHTRDNLARLDDLREEIDKQLARLQRQSRAAERYKELKQEERQYRAEQLALRWRELQRELEVRDRDIHESERRLEQVMNEHRSIEARTEQQRQQHDEATESLNTVQGRYYSLGAEISSVEQNIRHQQELKERQRQDLESLEQELREAQQTLDSDRTNIRELEQKLEQDGPELERVRDSEAEVSLQSRNAEQAMQDWQQEWDALNRKLADAEQQEQVEHSRIEQLHRQAEQLRQRQQRIELEQRALSGEDVQSIIEELQQKHHDVEQHKSEQESRLGEVLTLIRETRERIVEAEQTSAEQRRGIHDLQGRLSSLEALQQSALGKEDRPVSHWLQRHGMAERRRLAQQLEVEPGWERAVETVLGDALEAVCVDDIDALSATLGELTESNLALVETRGASVEASSPDDRLMHKVRTEVDLEPFLHGIRVAEDIDAALRMRASLGNDESVITRDGVWFGRHWLRIHRDKDARQGVLAREHDIRELKKQLEDREQAHAAHGQKLQQLRDELHAGEHQREEIQASINHKHAELNEIQSQINSSRSRQEHISARGRNLAEELAEIEQQLNEHARDVEQATIRRDDSSGSLESFRSDRERLSGQRDDLQAEVQQHRQTLRQHREQVQELAVRIEGMRSRRQSLESGIERLVQAQEQRELRKSELQAVLNTAAEPIERLEAQLRELLDQRLKTEQELAESRRKVDTINHTLRELETQRNDNEAKAEAVRGKLEKLRLDSQETRVLGKTALEQLEETGHEPQALLQSLQESDSSADWNEKITTIGKRISRLGPINLAAIDEYKEELERKKYLDEQYQDVSEALDTLESAIAKIDKETRQRFKETYEHVNGRLKDKFPRLFGGGEAYLEMTGDDLLNTGITVMARPPGKRISNIHLMSGGEKALTAVALVFAIFELNPAPFCILDEVDAPLDEANVGRFCQLVKEMSETVQFIYITHNKTTMEVSEQLSGVTMREAGVSRLVSVDVAEAATMAAV